MASSFQSGTNRSWQTSWLDPNFAQIVQNTAIPCSVTGTNTLVLTPLNSAPLPMAYANYQQWSGVFANDNTGAGTAQILGVGAALPVYSDTTTGPAALVGGEMQAGNCFVLTFDLALNSGAGGFHLAVVPTALAAATVAAGLTATGTTQGTALSLAATYSQFSTVAANTGGVLAGQVGQQQWVWNNGANDLKVYPPSGAQIDSEGTNTAVVIAAGDWAGYVKISATQVLTLLPAGPTEATGLVATGTDQATALPLAATDNQFGTVATGTGCVLNGQIGQQQWLWNDGANDLNVYPPSGAQIDTAGTDTAVVLAAAAKAGYVKLTATQIRTL